MATSYWKRSTIAGEDQVTLTERELSNGQFTTTAKVTRNGKPVAAGEISRDERYDDVESARFTAKTVLGWNGFRETKRK